jgi:hypothetical protein
MFIYVDLFIVVPLSISLSLISPCENLSIEKPKFALISFKTLTSLIGAFIL